MKPEIYFLKYAFPCSYLIKDLRKEITSKEYEKLKESALKDIVLEREFLERVFFRAFERMNKTACQLNKDIWDNSVIKRYFLEDHNSFLDSSEYPEYFKELCYVHTSRIIDTSNKDKLKVSYKHQNSEKQREVFRDFIPDAKKGDLITTHHHYAVEKL